MPLTARIVSELFIMNNINILLLASEITKGMKSIGPKCLLKLNTHISILDYQIQQAKTAFKNPNIIVLTGFESERVKRHIENNYTNTQVICDNAYASSNQTSAVLTALHSLENLTNLLIVGSGILFKNYPKIKSNDQSILFYLDKTKDHFNIGSFDQKDTQYLFYGLPNTWAECVFLNHKAIQFMSKLNKDVFGQLYLFETINKLLELDDIAFCSQIIDKKSIFKVASHKDLPKAKRFSIV